MESRCGWFDPKRDGARKNEMGRRSPDDELTGNQGELPHVGRACLGESESMRVDIALESCRGERAWNPVLLIKSERRDILAAHDRHRVPARDASVGKRHSHV